MATTGSGTEESGAPLNVYTVNYPLQYLAARVGGNRVKVHLPLPVDEDPAFWSPDLATVLDYQRADIILLNGAGYAAWVERVSLVPSRVVDTSAGFSDRLLNLNDSVVHIHGPQGEHARDNLAFTLWLDPQLAILQATAIRDAFAARLPGAINLFDENLAALTEDFNVLDAGLEEVFARVGNRPVIYSHPVYQYLDERYDLKGSTRHWEPGETPTERELSELGDLSGALLIWEAEPLEKTSAQLQSMGITSVVFDICATRREAGNFLDVMRNNLKRLNAVLPETSDPQSSDGL